MDNLLLAMWLSGEISEIVTVIPRTATSLFYRPVCRGMRVQFEPEFARARVWVAASFGSPAAYEREMAAILVSEIT